MVFSQTLAYVYTWSTYVLTPQRVAGEVKVYMDGSTIASVFAGFTPGSAQRTRTVYTHLEHHSSGYLGCCGVAVIVVVFGGFLQDCP